MTKSTILLFDAIREDPHQTLPRFHSGLWFDIQRAMLFNSYHVALVLDAFQLAHDLKTSLRVPSERRFPSRVGKQSRHQFVSSTKYNTFTTKDLKGKSAIGESSQQGVRGTQCFRC